ncbi:hypothetical protein [Thermodesulfovibrio sp. TK110]
MNIFVGKTKKNIKNFLKKFLIWHVILTVVFTTTMVSTHAVIKGFDFEKKYKEPETNKVLIITIGVINVYTGWLLYAINPVLLAVIEHLYGDPMFYGECRVKNIIKNGILRVGTATVMGGREEFHVYGVNQNGQIVENVCSFCPKQMKVHYEIKLQNYKPVETIFYDKTVSLSKVCSYAYLRAALKIEYLKERFSL